jgi:hypothetical protein
MKKNLHTSFIKFLLEKYSDESQRLPQQEPEDDNETPLRYKNKVSKNNITEDEEIEEPLPDEESTPETDIDEIQELLNEYKRLKRKNENNKVSNRRRK